MAVRDEATKREDLQSKARDAKANAARHDNGPGKNPAKAKKHSAEADALVRRILTGS